MIPGGLKIILNYSFKTFNGSTIIITLLLILGNHFYICCLILSARKVAVKDEVDGPSGPKKVKEESNGSAASGSESKCREQNKIMFKYRDVLKANLNKKQLVEILKYNKQEIPAGEETVLIYSQTYCMTLLGTKIYCTFGDIYSSQFLSS